ncbi:MAG: hypothetical protein US49_C0002G0129 [candidate division TM6 bacterium GW2011_GWF2_37_49]|nr:MAG: hypothetical protein US49_C0002G0129 [candidate division TM6 bacterium GW2011_GWF2_37_49]
MKNRFILQCLIIGIQILSCNLLLNAATSAEHTSTLTAPEQDVLVK